MYDYCHGMPKNDMCSRKHYTEACRYNIDTSIGRRVFADNNANRLICGVVYR